MLFILLLQWARKDCTNMSWACSGKCSYTIFTVRVLCDLVTRITMIVSKNQELEHRLNFVEHFEIIIRFYECCLSLKMLWNLCQPHGRSEEIISVLWPNHARRLSFSTDAGFCHMDTFPGINLSYSGGPAVLFLCCLSFHVLWVELTWGTAPAKTQHCQKKCTA